MTTLTASAIEGIVAAVGIEPDDRKLLSDDLAKAHATYQSFSAAYNQKSPPSLTATRRAAEALAAMLNSNPTVVGRLNAGQIDCLNELCERLRYLEKADKLYVGSDRVYGTPKDLFVGLWLPPIFEQRFAEKATVTRGGRFMLFATAVAETFHLGYGPETIIKAFAQAKREAEADYR